LHCTKGERLKDQYNDEKAIERDDGRRMIAFRLSERKGPNKNAVGGQERINRAHAERKKTKKPRREVFDHSPGKNQRTGKGEKAQPAQKVHGEQAAMRIGMKKDLEKFADHDPEQIEAQESPKEANYSYPRIGPGGQSIER
jgi:hypothetical protein